ncbi:O-methyltransferase-domain-containing protein, partial [Bombardia bombarda]
TKLADVAAWNIFISWKAFDHIPLVGSISITDLAAALDAQESLVARIAAILVATGKLNRPLSPSDHIAHSRLSPLYRSTHIVSALATVAAGNGLKPYAHWPAYFARFGRREPPGNTHTPFSVAWGHEELAPWEIKALYPEYAAAFTRSMRSREVVAGGVKIVGEGALYDFGWLGEEPARVRAALDAAGREGEGVAVWVPLVVDVGGGLGQLLRDMLSEVKGIRPERCVLQDRQEVIDEAITKGDPVLEGVVMMEHDFHEEQPVKGAKIYLLRRILLDYSDELATGILCRLAEALPADDPNARVIIMEPRLLESPSAQDCVWDLAMLNLGGKLRNEKMFGEIAAAAGLRVVGFHSREGDITCVVECAKA